MPRNYRHGEHQNRFIMEKQTPQELEFKAWGLSKIAVRNIVVFFILTLLTAITTLSRVVVALNDEKRETTRELLNCKDQNALKIEELKNENLRTVLRLNELLVNQSQIKDEIRDAKSTLQQVQKKIDK